MNEQELKNIIAAILLTSATPLTLEQLQAVFDEWQKPSLLQLEQALEGLKKDYETQALELVHVAQGYRLQTKVQYGMWIVRAQMEKPGKYSRALLETLAIIAYKQPVTRADIEEIRGVAVNSHIIKTLLEREWIRIAGYKDVVGKPAVYVTTKEFLNYFNLRHLQELPILPAAQPINEECTINEQ